jgi:hypothetical protein
MDVPRDFVIEVRDLLRKLVAEIEEHNAEYKHVTAQQLLRQAQDCECRLTKQLGLDQ